MKIEISIEKDGEDKPMEKEMPELEDEQKVAIGKKLQRNISLTRLERKLLASYLLKEEDD